MSPKNKKKLEVYGPNNNIDFINKRVSEGDEINIILKKIHTKSKKLNIDPKITSRIWKNMILSYIDYEKRNFKKK